VDVPFGARFVPGAFLAAVEAASEVSRQTTEQAFPFVVVLGNHRSHESLFVRLSCTAGRLWLVCVDARYYFFIFCGSSHRAIREEIPKMTLPDRIRCFLEMHEWHGVQQGMGATPIRRCACCGRVEVLVNKLGGDIWVKKEKRND
jgi:hypothetical protein